MSNLAGRLFARFQSRASTLFDALMASSDRYPWVADPRSPDTELAGIDLDAALKPTAARYLDDSRATPLPPVAGA